MKTFLLISCVFIREIGAFSKGCSLEVVVDPYFKSYFTEKVTQDVR